MATTTTTTNATKTASKLSWHRGDWEQRCGFRGGRFTRVNNFFALLAAIIATVGTYAVFYATPKLRISQMFLERGPMPYLIVLFSWWSCVILLIKFTKIRLQARALRFDVTPPTADFVLSVNTVDDVIQRIYAVADEPKQFIVFNRIITALSNLRNIGRISDVDDMLRSQADQDESAMETSYNVIQGFIWGIPVLGFIGTVLGLSDAISAFGGVLSSSSEMSQITAALRDVTGGLNTAFDTTLEALAAAMGIQLLLTFVKKSEEELLDSCSEFCLRQVVLKLRVMPYDAEE